MENAAARASRSRPIEPWEQPHLEAFALLLRLHRRAAGLSAAAVAGRAGLTPDGYRDFEYTRRRPRQSTVRRIGAALAAAVPDHPDITAELLRALGPVAAPESSRLRTIERRRDRRARRHRDEGRARRKPEGETKQRPEPLERAARTAQVVAPEVTPAPLEFLSAELTQLTEPGPASTVVAPAEPAEPSPPPPLPPPRARCVMYGCSTASLDVGHPCPMHGGPAVAVVPRAVAAPVESNSPTPAYIRCRKCGALVEARRQICPQCGRFPRP